MRYVVSQHNEFLQETYIDIPSLKETMLRYADKNGKQRQVHVDQQHKFVRRIFSRKSWEANGRFYGGFWQSVPSNYRSQIAINNLPSVEIDYKGLHVAILAAEKGVEARGDWYDLGRAILPQFDLEQQRKLVKQLVLTAINAPSTKSAYSAFRSDAPNGSDAKKLSGDDLDLLLNAFLEKHPYLAGSLCSDQGIRLMFLDSQITEKIITTFMNAEKPILPVHDSYIVTNMDTNLLHQAMRDASEEVIGVPLSVEQDGVGYDDVMNVMRRSRNYLNSELGDMIKIINKTQEYEERTKEFTEYKRRLGERSYWIG